jgi:hypothetical protein
MSGKTALPILTVALVLAGVARYFWNTPGIFDLALDDEAVYMGVETDFTQTILWPPEFKGIFSSYENGGFYMLTYRVLANFIRDPIDLYMLGGLVIILGAVLFGFLCQSILSNSLLVGVLAVCPVVLSGELMTWPRVSFGAIGVLALAFAAMARVGSFRLKVSVLLCAGYLLTFIRPEFILSFYVFLALQIATLLPLPLARRRIAGNPHTGGEAAAATLALTFVASLSVLWSFPIPSGGERAFAAFGAHYAVRFVAAHGLSLNPWLDWRAVLADQFPGAQTVFQVVTVRPGEAFLYFAANLRDLIAAIAEIAVSTVERNPAFSALWLLCVSVWIGSAFYPPRRRYDPSPMPAGRATEGSPFRRARLDIAFILVFALPPLVATIAIYPRHHYILLLLFTASSALAVVLRSVRSRVSPLLAVILAAWFPVTAKPLPVVEQPMLATVRALRAQPAIHRLFENDGGWCYFLVPRCSTDDATWMPDGTAFETYVHDRGIDAIVISERLRSYESLHDEGFIRSIDALTGLENWSRVDLGHGYSLLLAPR